MIISDLEFYAYMFQFGISVGLAWMLYNSIVDYKQDGGN